MGPEPAASPGLPGTGHRRPVPGRPAAVANRELVILWLVLVEPRPFTPADFT